MNKREFVENTIGTSLYETFVRNGINRDELIGFAMKHENTIPGSNKDSAAVILSKCMDNRNLNNLFDKEIEDFYNTIIMDWGYERTNVYSGKENDLFYIFKSLLVIWLKATKHSIDSNGLEDIIQSDITVKDYLDREKNKKTEDGNCYNPRSELWFKNIL